MRILVTGGTGFVGSHTVAELVGSGHEVKLLVRDPAGIEPALAPLGIGELSYAVGDVTDPGSIERAVQDCGAVFHAASVYSLDVRRAGLLREVNVRGTESVLTAATSAGLDPIVNVSSLVALFPPRPGEVLSENSPVKYPPGAYYRAKADAERVARRFQEQGWPVVNSYPGAIFGPNDPHLGESAQSVKDILSGRVPLTPSGGLSVVDVRDVARAHAAMFVPSLGPRRYVMSGRNMPFGEIVALLRDMTGRRILHRSLPAWSLRPFVRSTALLQRFLPFRLPVNNEGFDAIAWDPHGDDSRARADLQFTTRDPRQTFADTVQWLYESGNITARQAGRVAR